MTQPPQPPSQPPPQAPLQPLLALDVGSRRTGVAVADGLGMFAHTRPALSASSDAAMTEAIVALVQREAPGELIVGLPMSLNGGETSQAQATRAIAAQVAARTGVPVTFWDERLSSVQAGRGRKGRQPRDGTLDSRAAAVVLQAVLDSRRGGRS